MRLPNKFSAHDDIYDDIRILCINIVCVCLRVLCVCVSLDGSMCTTLLRFPSFITCITSRYTYWATVVTPVQISHWHIAIDTPNSMPKKKKKENVKFCNTKIHERNTRDKCTKLPNDLQFHWRFVFLNRRQKKSIDKLWLKWIEETGRKMNTLF